MGERETSNGIAVDIAATRTPGQAFAGAVFDPKDTRKRPSRA